MKQGMQATFACPLTEQVIEFDLPSDERAVVALWPHPIQIDCPMCDEVHQTGFRDLYVRALMEQFTCLPCDVKAASVQ